MKCDEAIISLEQLAEGSLDTQKKEMLELHLAQCDTCRSDFALMENVLRMKHTAFVDEVPTHYFNNFLLYVREHIESGQRRRSMLIPEFATKIFAPIVAACVVAVFVIAFTLLAPHTAPLPLHEMVQASSEDELSALATTNIRSMMIDRESTTNEKILETVSNSQLVVNKMRKDFFADENVLYSRTDSFLSIENTLAELDDEELQTVVQRLQL